MNYVMSDLHGCYEEFIKMLNLINFKKEDNLYIIGDIVDRGPEPIKLLKYIMDKPNIHVIMGNHEKMMINGLLNPNGRYFKKSYYNNKILWFNNGGKITESKFKAQRNNKKEEILSYLNNLPLYKEIVVNDKHYILIHGGVTDNFIEDFEKGIVSEDVLWERFEYLEKDDEVYPGKIIIVGHTPTFLYGYDGQIIKFGDKRLIDCGCVFGHSLGCLELETEKVYYVKI